MRIDFEIKNCGGGIYAVTAPMKEQIYLVLGEKQALVIDTGMGIGSLKAVINKLTHLPLIVVNTHGHPDHAGGNGEFDLPAYLHPADADVYNEMCTEEFRLSDVNKILGCSAPEFEKSIIKFAPKTLPLDVAQNIDLGGRILTLYHIPGHTHGSVMLYDSQTKTLFSGDALHTLDLWLYLDYSTALEAYHKSVADFEQNAPEIDRILAGHIPAPENTDVIHDMPILTGKILNGEIAGTPHKTFAGVGLRVEYKTAKIIYNPERLR
ncbi:MAG: MBL fold metallo-hydrolase [Clostridiales bacterium]|jgi:glyoxylase-like metal-dependent hydrolase (beta-lactamase superfamily II)|nr:MBL fold metallo-hydrolase [Clostridiales bacterium]